MAVARGCRRSSAAAARAGLSGIEFGVSIPGHGRWRRANERQRVRWRAGRRARVGRGRQRRRNRAAHPGPARIRLPALEPGRRGDRRPRRLSLARASAEQVQGALADLRERRKQAQPSGIRTFGSTFKNPDIRAAAGRTAGQLLEAAGCRGLRVGDAGVQRQARQLHREPRRRDDRRGVRADGQGRRRVWSASSGSSSSQRSRLLGPVELPERLTGERR